MKYLIKILRESRFLSIVFGSSIYTLGRIITWIMDFLPLDVFDLILSPIVGGVAGYIGWKVNQLRNREV